MASAVIPDLEARYPSEFQKAGSPRVSTIWFSRKVGTPFDQYTLGRRFRRENILDSGTAHLLELIGILRWVQLSGLVFAMSGLFYQLG
jgi:hypothetical protein